MSWDGAAARIEPTDTVAELAPRSADPLDFRRGEILASLSHELRTPLNAVIGFGEMIEREMLGPLGNRTYATYAQSITTSGRRLLSLIESALDATALDAAEALEEAPFDPALALREVASALAHAADTRGVRIDLDAPPGRVLVVGDRRRLKQVWYQLLANAVRYNHGGGVASVVLDGDGAGGLRVTVTDTGPGMEAAQLARAWQPLQLNEAAYTRRAGGLGIGLALARRLIQRHGGTIDIDSQPGAGTQVTTTLPVERVVAEAAEQLCLPL